MKLGNRDIKDTPQIIQKERIEATVRLVTHLQAEGKTVLGAKVKLLDILQESRQPASSLVNTEKKVKS